MDAAACIGCGACVAACKNASAMLFVAAKASHLNLLPQGKAEKDRRALQWSSRWMPKDLAAAPSPVPAKRFVQGNQPDFIARLNRDFGLAALKGK